MRKVIILLMAIVFCLICLSCSAEEGGKAEGESFTCGDYIYTLLDDGTAEITKYRGIEGTLEVPDKLDGYSVTAIGNWAFSWCSSPTTITLPESVTTIGDDAFTHCKNLITITLPDSVTTIGDEAFNGCSALTTITLPDSITAIGDEAFSRCSGLTTITLPDSVTAIGDEAFSWCSSLATITLPDSVTTIGDGAFYSCSALTTITLPDNVTAIGANPFECCGSLSEILVSPDHPALVTIDGVLFSKLDKKLVCYPCAFTQPEYTIPEGIKVIGDDAFTCSDLTTIILPASVDTIGDSAFSCCYRLTTITLPDSVTTIGDYAFYTCLGLTTITLPDSVTTIGDWAFISCSSLTTITLPDSVTVIGVNPFSGCENLTEIIVSPNHPTLKTIDGVLFSKSDKKLVCYPCAFKQSEYSIPQGIEIIGVWVFRGCSSLTTITLPNTVTTIGDYAFADCDNTTFTVYHDSWAEQYCINNKLSYTYSSIYGLATMKISTRSGPSTKYQDTGTYDLAGQYLEILARAYDDVNEIWWVKCVIPSNGRALWTGYKRFDQSTLPLERIPIEQG